MTCHIYVIAHVAGSECQGPVKVGISDAPENRLAGLQTGNPHPLKLLFSIAVPDRDIAGEMERAFHALNAESRMTGEWFDMNPWTALLNLTIYLELALRAELGDDRELIASALEKSGAYDARAMVSARRGVIH